MRKRASSLKNYDMLYTSLIIFLISPNFVSEIEISQTARVDKPILETGNVNIVSMHVRFIDPQGKN